MDHGAWKKPVVLEMYGRPGIIKVGDTLEAALLLLRGWHSRRTDAHTTAVLTCRDVLKGRAHPGLARAVFIDAALDAGYHILPETFLDERWGSSPVADDGPGNRMSNPESAPFDRSPIPPKAYSARPANASFGSERKGMPYLFGQLNEILGLIAIELLKNIAGLMNIELRRQPDKQTHFRQTQYRQTH